MQMPSRTLGPGRETDGPTVALHPQRYRLLGGLIIQLDQNTRTAGLRESDVRHCVIRMLALGAPILLELGEWVVGARMRIGTAPHLVGRRIIVRVEQAHKSLRALFLGVILKDAVQDKAEDQRSAQDNR